MKKYTLLLAGVLSLGLLAGCTQNNIQDDAMMESTDVIDPMEGESSDAMMQDGTQVVLVEQSDLGQSGTATLTENEAGNVVVTLSMSGTVFLEEQPAHIHAGACPTPGEVVYPLSNVVDGESQTTLDVTMDELLATEGGLAINVHRSADEVSTYTACGDVVSL